MTTDEKMLLSKAQKISEWNSKKLYYCAGKKHQRCWMLKRGEVYFADLGENVGSEENKIRPVVVIQSNSYNQKSPVFICAIISTSPMTIDDIQIPIVGTYNYVDKDGKSRNLVGTIDLGQIKTIGKERIVSRKICILKNEIPELDRKLLNTFGLTSLIKSKENRIKFLEKKLVK